MIIPTTVITNFKQDCAALSNFYPVELTYHSITYPTVEHAFQAAKTTNVSVRQEIADLPTAGAAKKAGRTVPDRVPYWTEYARFVVMDELLELKFSNVNPGLVALLLGTGDALLIEGNYWHDNVWGSCFCTAPSCKSSGANALGRALMRRRSELVSI